MKSGTRSIARRINRAWFGRMLMTFLVLDALLALLCVGGWCFSMESKAVHPVSDRKITWDHSLRLWERPATLTYAYTDGNGERQTVTGGAYFTMAQNVLAAFAGAEALLLVIQYGSGKKKAKRLLLPLERMAETARELSQRRFDTEKLHDLENAIAGVSPLAEGAQLRTGDRELLGLETAINDLMERTRAAYQEQTRFVSDASHELRTPIAVIQGYADMLQRWGKTDEKVLEEGISAIQTETAHMKVLVEQLLFLARGENGKTVLKPEDMDLSAMMTEVCEEYRMIHPDREWRLEAEEPLPVRADPALLKQAARILVDNAVRYTGEGDKITLRARCKEGSPCLEVQDNGIGIRAEDVEHIFDRFFRSDPARARSTGGTGLGLSIAKWIVERHGGYFDVYSREGIGTRIGVVLPQKKTESES